MDLNLLGDIIDDIDDDMMRITRPGTDSSVGQADYRMINGQFQPTLDMRPGEWQRWRIVYGSWLRNPLNLDIVAGDNCEMQLLAKDGIYINDYPREITLAPIPTGGRADIMVRCSQAGEYMVTDFDDEVILNLRVSGNSVNSRDLERWTPPTIPAYLESLQRESVDNDCECSTRMHGGNSCPGNFCVNEESFDPERYIHTIRFGEVIERALENAGAHPYHQHVYPFQITDNVDNDRSITSQQKAYFKEGDWHDVLMIDDLDDDLIVRYKPDVYDGRIMLHCHRLNHEDRGMMAQEHIIRNGRCDCNAQSVSLPVDPSQEASRTTPSGFGNNNDEDSSSESSSSDEDSSDEDSSDEEAANAPIGSGFIGCVSGRTTVDVKGKESAVAMEDVKIGDYVRVGEKLEYSRVYSFGHYNTAETLTYLRIHFEEGGKPLEITGNHMLFASEAAAVPASNIQVGDTLVGDRIVSKITTVQRQGAYAPFTYSGKALINGVVVSNYIAMGVPHWLAHAALTPRRLYCNLFWKQCKTEARSTNEDGIADWIYAPYRIVSFLLAISKTTGFCLAMFLLTTAVVRSNKNKQKTL